MVDRGGQTVSATTFAQLTGVSRERLRTWERRHGFPVPLRAGNGPRRYLLRDVARVVAVRRASESGMPIAEAVERAVFDDSPGELTAESFAAMVEQAPIPVDALTGPEPLAIAYRNGAVEALARGAGLERASSRLAASACGDQLRALFAGNHAEALCEHPRWDGRSGIARSIAFRLPVEPGRAPLVAMVGIEADRERALAAEVAALEEQLAALRERDERHERWMEAIVS